MDLKNKNIDICIWSDNYRKLANWYENILGLTVLEELDYPDDTGVGFDLGDNYLYIGKHDQVEGKNKDSFRIMVGLNVMSVKKTYEDLKNKGIEFIATPFLASPGGFWCATFKDPDNNILQITGQE